MKTSTAEPSALSLRSVQEGKVQKMLQKDDQEEIKVYLSKLQDLVPFMPKNKRLTKLQVIQYVIDYIRQLRLTLEIPQSSLSALDSFREKMANLHDSSSSSSSSSSSTPRQPLGVISSENSNPEIPPSKDIASISPDVDTRPVC